MKYPSGKRKDEMRLKRDLKRYHRNDNRREEEDGAPCIICGLGVKDPNAPHLWAHYGALEWVVTAERGEQLNETQPGADLGCWPIGPCCLKKNPQLKPFLIYLGGAR